MNNNIKLFLISTLIILILSLGCISATNVDNNETTVTKDTSTTTSTSNDKLESSKSYEVKTFDELQSALTTSDNDDVTVNMGNNITLAGNTTLSSTIKTLLLNGNGYTINGNNQYNFLTINNNQIVTIGNITIEHCQSMDNKGIISNDGELKLINTTLKDNTPLEFIQKDTQIYLNTNNTYIPTNGIIDIYNNSNLIKKGSVLSSGVINYTLNAGVYDLKLVVNGSDENLFNNNVFFVKINNTLVPTINYGISSNTKINTTIRVIVTGKTGYETPTGNITVYDDKNNTVGNGTLNEGISSIKLNITNSGNHTIKIAYSGDDIYNNLTGEANVTIYTLDSSISATNITGKINTPITFKVNVTSVDVINEGKVTVSDVYGNILATSNVTCGVATINIDKNAFNKTYNSLLIIDYNGSYNYKSSQSIINANISRLNVTIKTINNTKGSVGSNITINTLIVDESGSNVTSGYVNFIYNNTILKTVNITKGNATLNTKFTTISNTIQIRYFGEEKYLNTSKSYVFNLTKLNATVTVGKIKAYIRDNITLTANVTDSLGNKISYGNVYFRINGTNIRYANGSAVIAPVVNGTAKAVYMVPTTWNGNTTKFSAYYSSNIANTSSAISSNTTVNVTVRPVNLTFFTDSNTYYTGDTINVRVIITDKNILVNGGMVTFKFNGVTIKYTNGSSVQVAVKDGVASITYTLPASIGAGNHTFNIVFGGDVYQRYERTTKITILKTDVHVELSPIIATTNRTTISARVYDGHNNQVTGTTRISIKIAGVTFVNNVNITNGVINFTVNTRFATGLYDVVMSVGENSYYKGTRIDTKLLKT